MTAQYLIDTNVLVYVHDKGQGAKQKRSEEVLARLAVGPSGALSTQALSELANVLLRKLKPPMAAADVYAQLDTISRVFPVLPITQAVVLEAARGVRDHHFSFYDAQIWSLSKLNQIPVVLSEDFNSGSRIEGVSFLNPFDKSFDVSCL